MRTMPFSGPTSPAVLTSTRAALRGVIEWSNCMAPTRRAAPSRGANTGRAAAALQVPPLRPPLDIQMLPTRTDNYVYLFLNAATGEAGVVDPSDGVPVLDAASKLGWKLSTIVCTHYHGDHTGGNLEVKEATGATVVGPAAEADRVPGIDVAVADGDTVSLAGVPTAVLATPGHTTGHVAYHAAAQGAAFVGDTLFVLGCGRLFEGTAAEMWGSLCRLAALPDATVIYCGHEYTLGNLDFALTVESGNAALVERADRLRALRSHGDPTVPTTIGLEKATNPFLRCHLPELKEAIGMPGCTDVEAFAEVRRRKDKF